MNETEKHQRMSAAEIKKLRQSGTLDPALNQILSLFHARLTDLEEHTHWMGSGPMYPPSTQPQGEKV